MPSAEAELPWVVVSDTNKDGKSLAGFVRGHASEEEAKADAAERTERARKEFKKDWKYRAIPNPTLA